MPDSSKNPTSPSPTKNPLAVGLLLEKNFDQFQRTISPENGNQREEIKDVLDSLHAPVASHEAVENPLISLGTNGFMNLDTLLVIGNGGLRVVVAGHWVGPYK